MVAPGETIENGANNTCPDCNTKLVFEVLKSNAGYYIGTQCTCGPYSRESLYYYETREFAQHLLDTDSWARR